MRNSAGSFASYGVPSIEAPGRTILSLALGMFSFISLGVALGVLLPSARAAQGTGISLFFPMFLLAGGGPPPEAMHDVMRSIGTFLPLTHVIRASQEPWLGIGDGLPHLWIVLALLAASALVWYARSERVSTSA